MNANTYCAIQHFADIWLGVEDINHPSQDALKHALADCYEQGAKDVQTGVYKRERRESDMLPVPNTNLSVQASYNHDKSQVGVKTFEGGVTLCLYAWDVEKLQDYDALASKCEHEMVGTFRVMCQAIAQLTQQV